MTTRMYQAERKEESDGRYFQAQERKEKKNDKSSSACCLPVKASAKTKQKKKKKTPKQGYLGNLITPIPTTPFHTLRLQQP